jgi:tyrosine-protein phosphatase SIW14
VVRTLVQEDYPAENLAFLESAGIKFFQFPIPGNKEPFVVIPDTSVIGALETILDKRNHPILVHCNAGKVRPKTPQNNLSFCSVCGVSVLFVGRLTL